MAKNDPQYVKLADRLVRQIVADIDGGTGWSISGLDVKEFPSDDYPLSQNFVRGGLNRGVLEPATEEDYEAVQAASSDLFEATGVEVIPNKVQGYYSEEAVVGEAENDRLRIEAQRGIGDGLGRLDYEADRARKEANIAAHEASVAEETGKGAKKAEKAADDAAAEAEAAAKAADAKK